MRHARFVAWNLNMVITPTKATALRHALQQSWKLPDNLLSATGPDWIIVLLNKVDKDTRVK